MRKMMIGLSGRQTDIHDLTIYYDFYSYFDFVSMAGGLPLMLGNLTELQAESAAAQLDGIVITGGADVDPALYGQENTSSDVCQKDNENSDIYLYNAFKKTGKPIFLICRGIQIVNVIEGGTLIQDINTANPNSLQHNQWKMQPPVPRDQPTHDIHCEKGSRVYDIFGSDYKCNSFHHQALGKIAPCFKVTATCPVDGTVEAIENEQVTGVQWHPERLIHDEKHKQLMIRYIKECESFAKKTK